MHIRCSLGLNNLEVIQVITDGRETTALLQLPPSFCPFWSLPYFSMSSRCLTINPPLLEAAFIFSSKNALDPSFFYLLVPASARNLKGWSLLNQEKLTILIKKKKLPFIECLLYARHYVKSIMYINSFNHHNNHMR